MTERWTDEMLDRFASTVATAITSSNERMGRIEQAIEAEAIASRERHRELDAKFDRLMSLSERVIGVQDRLLTTQEQHQDRLRQHEARIARQDALIERLDTIIERLVYREGQDDRQGDT